MAAKHFVFWSAGALLVGGMFLLGGRLSRAAELSAGDPPLQPIPAPAPGMVPTPVAENPQPEPSPPAGQESAVEDQEYAEFCGMPYCSPPGRFWLRGDFLMWWSNGMRLPPLVTTSPQGTPRNQAGVLPTTIIVGDRTVANDGRPGFRTTLGMWLDNCHQWDLEFDYLNLGERTANYRETSTADRPIVARPLYDVQAIRQSSELVEYEPGIEGTVWVNVKDYFQSTGVSLSYCLCCCDACQPCEPCDPCAEGCGPPLLFCCRTDLLVGYRYYNLSDSVAIREEIRSLEPPTVDFVTTVDDSFRAHNNFHGSEVGLRSQIYRGRWSLELLAKVAVGNTHQVVDIAGQTTVTAPGQPTLVYDGGVLALRSNEGSYARDVFTMIPQLGAEVGYQVNYHWRAYVGYNLLYWGNVIRSADQIDLNVDPRNVPPVQDPATPFPSFPGRPSSFWAQGANAGVEFRF